MKCKRLEDTALRREEQRLKEVCRTCVFLNTDSGGYLESDARNGDGSRYDRSI